MSRLGLKSKYVQRAVLAETPDKKTEHHTKSHNTTKAEEKEKKEKEKKKTAAEADAVKVAYGIELASQEEQVCVQGRGGGSFRIVHTKSQSRMCN